MENLLNSARRALAPGGGWSREHESGHTPERSPGPSRPDLRLQLESRQSFGPAPPVLAAGARGDSLEHILEEEDALDTPGENGFAEVYVGSYRRLRLMHAATPILSVLVIASLVLAPPFLFETAFPPSHPPLLPHPIPSILFAASVWSLKHLIRIPLFSSFEYAGLPSWAAPAVHAVLSDALRFLSVPLLFSLSCSTPHDDARCHPAPSSRDPAFALAWFFALGWSATETAYAVFQTYEQLALYRDVLVPPPFLAGPDEALYPSGEAEAERSAVPRDYAEERRRSGMLTASPGGMADITEEMLEEELERLARVKARQELEEVYGMPIVHIPVFITALQRVASIVFALGVVLLLSAAYLRSAVSAHRVPVTNTVLYITFPLTTAVHAALSVIHGPPILAAIGLHTAAYTSMIVALGALFAGLGMWGVVV